MRIYLAARYSRRDQLRELAAELRRMGHTVTSRWLETDWGDRESDGHGSTAAPPEYRERYSLIDLEDIAAAEVVVNFTEAPNPNPGRGGRHVEFGYALALGKSLIVVGHHENLFHHHPGVAFYASQWDWLRTLPPEPR